jgi:hypothetical protein
VPVLSRGSVCPTPYFICREGDDLPRLSGCEKMGRFRPVKLCYPECLLLSVCFAASHLKMASP